VLSDFNALMPQHFAYTLYWYIVLKRYCSCKRMPDNVKGQRLGYSAFRTHPQFQILQIE
jgi:hypothetical protein